MPLSILVGFLVLLLVVGAIMMTFVGYVDGVWQQLKHHDISLNWFGIPKSVEF